MGKQKNLIKRFLKGNATIEEANKVDTWLDGATNGENPWQELSDAQKANFLEDLKRKIELSKQAGKKNRGGHASWLMIAAAVIIVAMIPVYSWWKQSSAGDIVKQTSREVVVRNGTAIKQLLLSDGSKVWLNAGSQLRYKPHYENSAREVYLVGQAYFEIARDVKRPFVVHGSSWEVTVLGTHFDVADYDEDNEVDVAVLSGKVVVHSMKIKAAPTVIHPGEKLMYNKTTQVLSKRTFTNDGLPSWVHKDVVFYHSKMTQVANYIKRNYGLTMHFSTPDIGNMEITGDFGKVDKADDLLTMICLTINAQYKLQGKIIMVTNIN